MKPLHVPERCRVAQSQTLRRIPPLGRKLEPSICTIEPPSFPHIDRETSKPRSPLPHIYSTSTSSYYSSKISANRSGWKDTAHNSAIELLMQGWEFPARSRLSRGWAVGKKTSNRHRHRHCSTINYTPYTLHRSLLFNLYELNPSVSRQLADPPRSELCDICTRSTGRCLVRD